MIQVIKNALLTNGKKVNILVEDGLIKDVVTAGDNSYPVLVDALGMYVSPGWIDIHTHAFPKYKPYCAFPDQIGYQTGVTTVVDAGSSGADTIEEFYQMAQVAKTRVLSFLNVSRIGLKQINELAEMDKISWELIREAVVTYPSFIVGLKARMSASVVGDNRIAPLQLAKKYGELLRKPLMVHVGNGPPMLNEVLPLLSKGDILTHCYHEKGENHIFANSGEVIPSLLDALRRGVYLDVGHGTSSFSFPIAKKAKQANIYFDTIGTDIYEDNQINGPVYSMATTLTKFLALGYSLEKIIQAVTEIPAQILNKPKLGNLNSGSQAEFTFFTVEQQREVLTDSMGNTIETKRVVKPQGVFLRGSILNLKRVINASGRMSILGVSTISDEVAEAMVYGGKHFVEMDSLHKEAGKLVANHTNQEAALVTNSASASIALAIAGLIVKDQAYYINHLYDASAPLKREILIMCGHKVDYGAPVEVMMRLGGAIPKEVGYANGCSIKQIEQAISDQTVGMLFIQSHHCVQKNMPSLEEVSLLCKKHGVPLIVDAAAEERIDGFSQLSDMVIFSGSKAIQGPTSGILAGKRQYINYAAMHNEGIGRSMKVGKESIFGLLKALETYDHSQMTKEEQLEILKQLEKLESIPGVSVSIQVDESGRDIYRGRIHIHNRKANRTALELVKRLKANDPAIYTRDYHANEGHIDIDPRPLKSKEIEVIVQTIIDIMEG